MATGSIAKHPRPLLSEIGEIEMRPVIGRPAVPDIRQSEAAECGLACLAMVLGYHGHDIDLGTLRRRHPTSLNGLTMRGLQALAGRLDLTTRALRLETE